MQTPWHMPTTGELGVVAGSGCAMAEGIRLVAGCNGRINRHVFGWVGGCEAVQDRLVQSDRGIKEKRCSGAWLAQQLQSWRAAQQAAGTEAAAWLGRSKQKGQ